MICSDCVCFVISHDFCASTVVKQGAYLSHLIIFLFWVWSLLIFPTFLRCRLGRMFYFGNWHNNSCTMPFRCLTSLSIRSASVQVDVTVVCLRQNRLGLYSPRSRVESCFWETAETCHGTGGGNMNDRTPSIRSGVLLVSVPCRVAGSTIDFIWSD